MPSNITVLRSDLIELRLRQLGGTGGTLLEQARSLDGALSPACMRRIRAVAAMRERYGHPFAMKKLDRIDVQLFLEDCDAVERQLAALLRQAMGPRASQRHLECEPAAA